jgi:hypothetical protein
MFLFLDFFDPLTFGYLRFFEGSTVGKKPPLQFLLLFIKGVYRCTRCTRKKEKKEKKERKKASRLKLKLKLKLRRHEDLKPSLERIIPFFFIL